MYGLQKHMAGAKHKIGAQQMRPTFLFDFFQIFAIIIVEKEMEVKL